MSTRRYGLVLERAAGASRTVAIDLADARHLIDPLWSVSAPHRAARLEALTAQGAAALNELADTQARQWNQMCEAGDLNPASSERRCLAYCKGEAQVLGFQVGTAETAHFGEQGNFMLVAGCQDPAVLRSRVEAAHEFVLATGRPFVVVLSGSNPGAGVSRTPNEAREMREIWINCGGILPQGTQLSPIDESANDSVQNLVQFMKAVEQTGTRPRTFTLVSSSSHLPRLAQTFDSITDPDLDLPVTLVGVEPSDKPLSGRSRPVARRRLFYEAARLAIASNELFAESQLAALERQDEQLEDQEESRLRHPTGGLRTTESRQRATQLAFNL